MNNNKETIYQKYTFYEIGNSWIYDNNNEALADFDNPYDIKRNIQYENNLPIPYVHYPHKAGVFFGYSKSKYSKIYFCECNRKAILNYFEFLKKIDIFNVHPLTLTPLHYNPIKYSFPVNYQNFIYSYDKLSFKSGICHKCNKIIEKYEIYYPINQLEIGTSKLLTNKGVVHIFTDTFDIPLMNKLEYVNFYNIVHYKIKNLIDKSNVHKIPIITSKRRQEIINEIKKKVYKEYDYNPLVA